MKAFFFFACLVCSAIAAETGAGNTNDDTKPDNGGTTETVKVSDLTCTSGGNYTTKATVCENKFSDETCASLFVSDKETAVVAGSNVERPYKCFKLNKDDKTPNDGQKEFAAANCAKTCGYCCLSSEYNCEDARIPTMDCAKVTSSMCKSALWRDIIAKDCPSACGFCNMGGCVDKVEGCQAQSCRAIGMENFVNENCRRTCDLCDKVAPFVASTTTSSTSTTSSPSAVAPSPSSGPSPSTCDDEHPSCRSWVKNGFCTKTFYNAAQKRKYCRKSCNMC